MSVRDKDSSDFDLETFVDLFDTAMTSDNPAVQKAFKNLLMITAIVHAKQDEFDSRRGPLRRLVDDIQNLNRRIGELENQKIYPGGGVVTPVPMPTYPVGPTWVTPNTGNTPWPGTGTPQWPNPGTTITCSASSTAFDDQFAPDPNAKVLGLYDKLEAK
jgi:hypothetical protein